MIPFPQLALALDRAQARRRGEAPPEAADVLEPDAIGADEYVDEPTRAAQAATVADDVSHEIDIGDVVAEEES